MIRKNLRSQARLKAAVIGKEAIDVKVLINFADKNYKEQQKYNTKTGYRIGKFDKVIEFSPDNIPESYKTAHNDIFSVSRGYGLWLWKPYFILETLKKLNDGDYLFYCDSGAYFMESVDLLIAVMERDKQEVMCYEIPLLECQWTSKTCSDGMNCFDEKYLLTPQRCASYMLIKKSAFSMDVISSYLKYCENYELLSGGDLGNMCLAHREDQSIWSLVTKQYGIKAYRDPSQYGFLPGSYIRYGMRIKGLALAGYTDQCKASYPCVLYLYRKGADYKLVHRMVNKLKLKRNLYFNSKL